MSNWIIPALGKDVVFKSEDQAFEYLGELWARISELVLENYKGKEHDESWLSKLEPDTLRWTKSKKDITAKRIYLLFDDYLANNAWTKEDMLEYIEKIGSKKPGEYWDDLAFKNNGSFFVWPSKIYKEEDSYPAYPKMVPKKTMTKKVSSKRKTGGKRRSSQRRRF